jgi:hypothetical protein
LLEIAAIEDNKIDNTFTSVNGTINLDSANLETNIVSMTLSEIVKGKKPDESTNATEL